MRRGRAALALLLSMVILAALPYLLALALDALGGFWFEVWGVNYENIARAPLWLSLLYVNYGTICASLQNIVLLPLSMILLRVFARERLPFGRGAARGAIAGAALALAIFAILRATDLARPGYSYVSPRFSLSALVSVFATACAALGGEAFFRGVLLELSKPFGRVPGTILSVLAFALLTANLRAPILMLNTALIGLLCCLLYQKTGGIAAGFCFRFAYLTILFPILGFEGGAGFALYETYARVLPLIGGGALGPLNGLLATALLIPLNLWLFWDISSPKRWFCPSRSPRKPLR